MRLSSFLSNPAFSSPQSASAIKTTRAGGQNPQVDTLIAENNKRIDGVLRHRNPSPEVRAKIEAFRKQFSDRLTQAAQNTTDRGRIMSEYREARSQLSDGLTDVFGGPRAG